MYQRFQGGSQAQKRRSRRHGRALAGRLRIILSRLRKCRQIVSELGIVC